MRPLPRTFHIGGYWRGPNDMVRQMMLGLKAAGAEMFEYNTDEHPEALDFEGREYDRGRFGPVWIRMEEVGPEIRAFGAELIVCNAGGLSFRPDDAKQLRKSARLLGIALSDPDVFALSTRRIAQNFDLFLTNAQDCVAAYSSLGVNAGVLPLATNEEFFHPVPQRQEMSCEVLIVGRAHNDRIEPVRRLRELFDTRIHGEGWDAFGIGSLPPIYADELLCALNSARVTVVFSRTPAGHAIGKVAVFDFIAAGAQLAVERVAAFDAYLDWKEEILGFRDTEELLRKIRFVLDHPEAARTIRERGRARVLTEHTWRKVWPRLVAQMEMVR